MSKSNSHENLSTLSIDKEHLSTMSIEEESEVPHPEATNEAGNQGSDSDDTSEDEELLQNVIKSAWEHNRNISKVRFINNDKFINLETKLLSKLSIKM